MASCVDVHSLWTAEDAGRATPIVDVNANEAAE